MILANLCPVAQHVIGQDAGHHGLADGYGTDTDTGIMPAFGRNFGSGARRIDAAPGDEDG